MSLQLLAKQMEAKGRKGDSMLVHMTADEVAGLQKLAESAGGSLSVNPETGLVEANFLKRMLPTLVGIGLGMTGVGLPAAMAAGALTGGIQAKRNDQDVGMGALLGGLGAMGGANLASGLATAGGSAATGAATSAATGAGTTAAGQQVGQQVAQDAATQAAMSEGLKTGGAEAAQNVLQNQAAAAGAEGTIGETAAQEFAQKAAAQPTMYTYDDGSTLSALADGTTTATPGTDVVQPATATSRFEQVGRGIENMGTDRGQEAFATKFGTKSAMAGAAPLLAPEKIKEDELEEDDEMYYTEYTPGQTGERSSTSTEAQQLAERRFSPMERIKADDYMERRNRRYAAEGGLMRLAEGGATNAAPAGNSGASADAMSYLMGQAPSSSGAPSASQAGLQYLMGQTSQSPVMQSAAARQAQASNFVAPERGFGDDISSTKGYTEITEGPNAGMYQGDAKFAFDPASQKYYRTDKLFKYVEPAPEPVYDPYYHGGNAAGGLLSLAKGGMKSGGFVIPADVVSMVGEGNTDAGYSRIKSMVPGATAIKGKDGGQADTVKTSIEGKQPARVAHGEMYIPPETVKRMGGAKKLYAMMDRVRAQATGSKKQIRPVSLKKALA
jgi:hypothetical protein